MSNDYEQFNLFDEEPKPPVFKHRKPEKKPEERFDDLERLRHLKSSRYFADESRLNGAAGARRQVRNAYLSALEMGKSEEEALAFKEEALNTPPGPRTKTKKREIIRRSDEKIAKSIEEKILGCIACSRVECPWRTTTKVEYDELVALMAANKENGATLVKSLEDNPSGMCPEILGYLEKNK